MASLTGQREHATALRAELDRAESALPEVRVETQDRITRSSSSLLESLVAQDARSTEIALGLN
jgi:hypothetical protein